MPTAGCKCARAVSCFPSWRSRRAEARETYRAISADEFEELFELAAPGKPFELYSRARLKRVQVTRTR